MADNSINIKLELEIKEAKQKIEALEKEIKQLGDKENYTNKQTKNLEKSLDDINKKSNDLIKTMSSLALKIGVAFGAGEIIKNMAEFQASISKLGAISGATKSQIEELRQKAIDLGGSSVYSSSQVADAMNYLAMAGFKTNQILASTKDVLNLATIGNMDLARASDIASNILTGFGISADKTNQVVDVMTATITNANTDITQLGDAMKYVAPQAKAMGINIQETSTAIGILSNAGIQGTMAGTGLAGMLTRLANPTGQAGKVIKELGIQVYDANGKFVGLGNVLKQFNEKLKGLTNEQRIKALSTIFGQEHLKSAIVLINSMNGDYQKLLNTIDKSAGISDKIAKKMQDNLLGAWKGLLSSLDRLWQTIGKDLLPVLTQMVKDISSVVNAGTEFYKNNKALIQTITELSIAIYGFVKLRAILLGVFGADMVLNIANMSAGLAKLKEAFIMLRTAIMGLSVAQAMLGGLTLAITGIIYALNEAQESLDEFNATTDKLIDNTKQTKTAFQEIANHTGEFRGQIVATKNELDDMQKKIKDNLKNTENLIKSIKEKINNYGVTDKIVDYFANTDRLRDYENELGVLEDKEKVLKETLKKIQNTKPHKEHELNAKKYTKTLITLTQAQQKYLNNLDKELAKAKGINQTAKQSMKDEINRARQILGLTTQFEEAKAKIKKIYALKEIANFKKEYQTRIREHSNTINRLEAKEKSLTNKIIQLHEQLNAKLRSLENQRILDIGNIEDRIQNLQMSGATEYQKYVMIKQRADMKYALAKKALEQGNFQLAKSYMSQYSSLISQLGNKEIKENGRVVISKKQANQIAIQNLRQLEALTNAYYAKEKQNAINSYNAKIRVIKAQLEATKEQLKLEVQRLNLEKQIIQIMTGKKVDIDTSGALNEIKNLDKQIKNLDNQIKHPKKIKVTADTTQAKQKVSSEINQFQNKKVTAKVTADTTQAKAQLNGVLQITDKLTGKTQTIKYTSNGEEVKKEVGGVLQITDKLTGKTKTLKIGADTKQAKNNTDAVLKITDKLTGKTKTIKIGADGSKAENEINKLKKPTESKHEVKLPNINQVEHKIESLNNKNTHSTHTIYVREVTQKKTGGLINPIKRATGGDVNFKRKSGRIAGYDPTDSDDVPALLTRGEFVIKRDAVAHYGDSFLYAINNKILPKYATGGIVEKGHPQRIAQEIKRNLNEIQNNNYNVNNSENNYNNFNNTELGEAVNIDLSKFDELIDKLKELAKTFKNGGADDKSNLALKLIKTLESKKDNISNALEEEKKDEENFYNYKNSIVGQVLDEKKYKSYESALLSKKKLVDNDNKHLTLLDKEKENELKKISDKIEEFENYLNKVDEIKSKINDKVSSLDIELPKELSSKIENSLNLDKLNSFYEKINKLNVNKYIDKIKNKYKSKMDFLAQDVSYRGAEEYYGSLDSLGMETLYKEKNEYYAIKSKLGDEEALKEEALKEIMKHLPKFQTGGLLQLQTGGKLAGYGGGDRNLALLEDGEFVIRKEAVSHFGTGLFDNLNKLKLPKFQTGGYVDFNSINSNVGNSVNRDVVDINFNIGEKSYKLNGSLDVAKELSQALKQMI